MLCVEANPMENNEVKKLIPIDDGANFNEDKGILIDDGANPILVKVNSFMLLVLKYDTCR